MWFAPVRSVKKQSLVKRAGKLLKAAGIKDAIEEDDLVAIKLHFGEEGNTGFVHPIFLREVVRRVRKRGGKPFLTDGNTLYRGKRVNAVDHLDVRHPQRLLASPPSTRPSSSPTGSMAETASTCRSRASSTSTSVRIGAAAVHADAMVVVTHVKGHEATGFGGAMKNVGMGLGCAQRQAAHALRLQATGQRREVHGLQALREVVPGQRDHHRPDRVAVVDYELCYGCGECVAACPYGAIAIQWKTDAGGHPGEDRRARAPARSRARTGKVVYLSFVTNVSPDCDCWNFSDARVVRRHRRARLDRHRRHRPGRLRPGHAAHGLPGSAGEGMGAGADKFSDDHRHRRYASRCAMPRSMGLGTRDYELKTLE